MVEHFKRGISYRYFTSLLVVIGIVLPGRSTILYCLQTWLPNILYLGFLGLAAILNYPSYKPLLQNLLYELPANVTDQIAYSDDNGTSTDKEHDAKIVTSNCVFFFHNFVYRLLLFTFLFFKRRASWDIRRELNMIKHNLKQPDRYKRRVFKFAFLYLLLVTALFSLLLTVDFLEVSDTINLEYPLWFTATVCESLGLRLNEAVCAFAVEGYLFYYCLALGYQLDELNETIRLVNIQEFTKAVQLEMNGEVNMVNVNLKESDSTTFVEQQEEEEGLQPIRKFKHIRLTLGSVHEIFKKCSRFLSSLLAISMLSSVITLCFAVFWIDISDGNTLTESLPSFLYLLLMMVVASVKIVLMCLFSDYCHNKVTRTYALITALQLSDNSVSRLSREVALLSLSQKVFSFRFTLGGICKLKKAVLPTIAGAVITFALILAEG